MMGFKDPDKFISSLVLSPWLDREILVSMRLTKIRSELSKRFCRYELRGDGKLIIRREHRAYLEEMADELAVTWAAMRSSAMRDSYGIQLCEVLAFLGHAKEAQQLASKIDTPDASAFLTSYGKRIRKSLSNSDHPKR
jgi:hypothetical protein